jgi:type IV pilus assembly protein PilM
MIFQSRALGLEIFQNGFSWVVASGTAAAPRIERYETVISADNILKPSIKELNVTDPKKLGSAIIESYYRLSTPTVRVSLSIPESAGKVITLEMDAPVKSKEEGIDQIKWKLKKSFPLDLSDIHLDYQVLKETAPGVSTLLVALVSRNIINEYEELLLVNGLEPSKIDFTPFNIYRLFASQLEIEEQLVFVISCRGSLAVLIFQDGILDFFRSKQVSFALNDPVRLYREINSSLLVYSDLKGGWKPQKVYYYAPPEVKPLFRNVIFEVTGTEPLHVDTDVFINSSRQKIDRKNLPDTLSALGAAARSLG